MSALQGPLKALLAEPDAFQLDPAELTDSVGRAANEARLLQHAIAFWDSIIKNLENLPVYVSPSPPSL